MANLLGWLKRGANVVNNDVLQPINRDVYQPIQRDVAWPVANVAAKAPAYIGNNFVSPLAQFPIDAATNIYNNAIAPRFQLPHLSPNETALRGIANRVHATGSLHQLLGSGAQTALTLASGGIANGIEAGATAALNPEAASTAIGLARLGLNQVDAPIGMAAKYATGALTGGLLNAGFGGASAAGAGASPKQIAKATALNAAIGGGLGVGGIAAGDAARYGLPKVEAGIKNTFAGARSVANKTVPLNQAGSIKLPNFGRANPANRAATKASGLKPEQVVSSGETNMLRDWATYKKGDLKATANEINLLDNNVRTVGKRAGIDVITGSPDDIANRVENYVSQRKQFIDAKTSVGQGGFARIAKGKDNSPALPSVSLKNTKSSVEGGVKPAGKGSGKAELIAERKSIISPNAATTFENAKIASKQTIRGQIKEKFNPVTEYGKAGKAAASKFQSKLGELSSALRPAKAESATRQAVFDKMTPAEHLDFINKMQHGQPQATPELQTIADQYTKFNKEGAQVAAGIKPDFKSMENYFTQAGLMSRGDASRLAQLWIDKSNTPGSLQRRTFPSVQEAVSFANENGVKLKNTNPESLFINNHQQVLTSGKLNEFKAEQLAQGVDPAITQKLIDRYSERGLSGGAGFNAYRKGAGTLNNIQLAGGFHFGKIALEKINSDTSTFLNQVLSGHPFKAVESGTKNAVSDIAGFGYFKGRDFAKDVANGVENKYTEAARLANYNPAPDARYAVNGLRKSWNEVTSGSPLQATKGLVLSPLRLINTAMSPLMKHWVPNIKNAAFQAQVDAADTILGKGANQADRALAYQKAGNTVDGIMGQMNQDNLFWNKTAKDSLGVLMRSPGYNIGTVQQVGGGFKDLLSPSTYKNLAQGKGLSTRAAYAASMTVNTMFLGAVINYAFTGSGPKELKDYFYPRTGQTDKNGNAERISLPSYTKDVFAFMHSPTSTVSNKLGPVWSEGRQLATNKNYYGDMIRNPQDSIGTQAKQVGTYLKQANLPFTAQSMNKRVDKSVASKAESFFGAQVAPGYVTQSGFQQKVQRALNKAVGSTAATPEQQLLITDKSKAKDAARNGDYSLLNKLVSSGQITAKQGDNLVQSAGQTSLENQFSYLLKVDKNAASNLIAHALPGDIAKLSPSDVAKAQDALVLAKTKANQSSGAFNSSGGTSTSKDITALPSGSYSANINGSDKTFKTQSQAQTAIDYQDFQGSGKNYALSSDGKTVFRVSADGKPSQMSKTQFDYQVGAANLTHLKNVGDLNGWLKTANSQVQSLQTQLKDPNVDSLDKIGLQDKLDTLQKNISKYVGYGGFTKGGRNGGGRAGSRALTGSFKTASKSFKPPKGIKVRVAKGNFKAPSVRKLAVSKIPSNYLSKKLA